MFVVNRPMQSSPAIIILKIPYSTISHKNFGNFVLALLGSKMQCRLSRVVPGRPISIFTKKQLKNFDWTPQDGSVQRCIST